MMNRPAVSIVITTHNHCHFLQEALAGVWAQSFADFEVIVVDNASEDETWAWLGAQTDGRLFKHRLESNAGRARARNTGLAAARGEFILFLNQEQQLPSNALQTHIEALTQFPHAIAGVAGAAEFDASGVRNTKRLVRRRAVRELWPEVMFGWAALAGQCLLRTHAVRAANGWTEDAAYLGLEEHVLWLQIARRGPAVLLPEVLLKYRPRRGQSETPHVWKTLTKLRKRAVEALAPEIAERAQRLLQAREEFRNAKVHEQRGEPWPALRDYRNALRAAPELWRSPLTRPLFLKAMIKCCAGAPWLRVAAQRLFRKMDIPLEHAETTSAVSVKVNEALAKRKNAEAMNFIDRSKLLGLNHELKWLWVKNFGATRWRKLAERYQWIFILGCNNSGTTLLTRMLEAHPAVSGVPRGGRGATVVLLPPRRAEVIRLWTEKIELFRLTEADRHLDDLRLKYDWISAVRLSPRPFILEKAPPDMICARWFQAVFPNARFIGLVRNGYAVAEGMNRREGYGLERCARHWGTANRIMMNDAEHLEHFMLVRYEELVQDARAVMRRVCKFLDLDSNPIQAIIDKEWQVHNMDNAAAHIQDFNLKSFERLQERDLAIINHGAGEMLERLGYLRPELGRTRSALTRETQIQHG